MTMTGTVRNGQIVFSQGLHLPEGSEVEVEIIQVKGQRSQTAPEPTLRGLLKFAGAITDLPADSSVNLDHYLYGAPKVD